MVYMNTSNQLPATDNRARMRQLCALAGSQQAAADLIAKHTRRPCSTDAVKSWTCDPDSSRARTCQSWAVKALEKELKRAGKIA